MRKIPFLLFAIAAIAMTACGPMANSSVDPELAAAVRAKIESRDYTIHFDRATPNSPVLSRFPNLNNRMMNLTPDYNIRIDGDMLHSYLPYFGEAYTAILGRQDGLVFDEPVTGYKVAERRRGFTEIKFTTRTFEDRYDYTIEVYPNGMCYLIVNPDRKSSISFDGKLELEE